MNSAMRSRLEPFKKFVGMLRSHLDGVLAWTKTRLSTGAVEVWTTRSSRSVTAHSDSAPQRISSRPSITAVPDCHCQSNANYTFWIRAKNVTKKIQEGLVRVTASDR